MSLGGSPRSRRGPSGAVCEWEAAARMVEAVINSRPPFEDLAAAMWARVDRLAEPLNAWENEGGAL